MNHVGAVAGQVVAHIQQAPRLDLQAGFLSHLAHESGGQGLAFFDLAAGQAPRPAGIGVLVQQQDAVVLDDDAGHSHMLAAALSDADHRVRLRAVSGLVSTGAARLVAGAAADRSREVRIAVADGLAALAAELTETGPADAREALERLAGDPDVLVRAAAFKAAGALGCPPPLDTLAVRVLRRTAAAWEDRAGAAQALAPMHAYPAAVEALHAAASDSDAEVRAYARYAVDRYAAKAGSS